MLESRLRLWVASNSCFKIFGPSSNSKIELMCENEACVQIALVPICTQGHYIAYKKPVPKT